MKRRPQIAIAFFGITRSLAQTIESIRENVLNPARKAGDVVVCSHFFRQARIDNTRTGEAGALDPDEWRLLSPDRAEFDAPGTLLEAAGFGEIKAFGDHWDDGFKTVSNLLHQLHSLKAVTRLALAEDPDVVVFCRPDLRYHDSLGPGLARALTASRPGVYLPRWQRHKGGFNDRFAICAGRKAAQAYGNRAEQALRFCRLTGLELHSERLIRFALREAAVEVHRLDVRASRVRADGREVEEDFTPRTWKQLRNDLRFRRIMARARRG